jgi:hypothetical protein
MGFTYGKYWGKIKVFGILVGKTERRRKLGIEEGLEVGLKE